MQMESHFGVMMLPLFLRLACPLGGASTAGAS